MNDEELILVMIADPTLTVEEARTAADALKALVADGPRDPSVLRDIVAPARSSGSGRRRDTAVAAA